MNPVEANPVVASAVTAFTGLFGKPIDLWIFRDSEWHHIVDTTPRSVSQPDLEAEFISPQTLPLSPESVKEPTVIEIKSGVFLIGTPLALLKSATMPVGAKGLAWGTVHLTPETLVKSLLNLSTEKETLAREADELRAGLSPHLEQISYDFEELTYLRRLGEQTDLRDVSNPLADLAERILTELCSLIRATSLLFIGVDSRDPLVQSESETLTVGKPITWIGARNLTDSQCVELIEKIGGGVPTDKPAVQNHMQLEERFGEFIGINSCVQIPVIHRGNCYGWLVALNRVPASARSSDVFDSIPESLSDDEFGTGEASLLTSAAGTLAAHYRNAELFRERELLLIGVVRALINAIDAKDSYTCGHSDRVAFISKSIGHQLGLDTAECERLYMSGLLHDLGKIGIPDQVLLKPGKLTDEEFAIIRQHPTIGHSILHHLPQLRQVLPGVLHHHESVDGRGYPHGLRDDDIPLFARILAVADSYDAMTSARPYRTAMTTEKAEAILMEGAGKQWDATVVQAFMAALPAIKEASDDCAQDWQALLNQPHHATGVHTQGSSDTIARAVSGFVTHSPAKASTFPAETPVKRMAEAVRQ